MIVDTNWPGTYEMYSAGDVQQFVFIFPNGYGASVIRGKYAYADEGTWEVGVLKVEFGVRKLCYDTYITDDVLRYVPTEEVLRVLKKIEALPSHQHVSPENGEERN